MKRLVVLALVGGCGGGPAGTVDAPSSVADAPIPAICVEAEQHSDLTWIQQNVFDKQCTFSGCHNGAPDDAGKMDLRDGMSIASIVGVASHMCPTATRVIAGNSNGSWMMKMLGQVQDTTPPSCAIDQKIGLMPMDNMGELLCVQKRDAIQRWIDAGAMND